MMVRFRPMWVKNSAATDPGTPWAARRSTTSSQRPWRVSSWRPNRRAANGSLRRRADAWPPLGFPLALANAIYRYSCRLIGLNIAAHAEVKDVLVPW